MTGRRPATGQVVQGTLEMSGTDTIRAMIAVTSASQAAQSGLNVIASINEMMGRAISLGRVSGN
jgi:flagellar basal body rod protein FlgG